MSEFIVKGGKSLNGEVKVSGSKNAALPILCAAMLTEDKVVLKNVPDIADIRSMIRILEAFGAKIQFEGDTLEINPKEVKKTQVPEHLINQMRASILIIGGLLPRVKEIKISFPGGCVLGKRSVDAHTHALKEFGGEIIDDKKGLHVKAENLQGKKIILPEMSVTATENAIMLAVVSKGDSEIRLAANEPHVQDLCNFLVEMGAKIQGIGTNNFKITGDF